MNIANILTRLAEKISKVFDAGKKAGRDAEWSEFWDAYQQNGKRGGYTYAFYGSGWNDKTFKPKYDIVFASGGNNNTQVFNSAGFTDFAGILEKQGVILDTSAYNGPNPAAWFSGCQLVTRIPTIDVCNAPNGCSGIFNNCKKLHTIEKMILSENGTTFTSTSFQNCNALEEIRFEGKIASDINFGDCPLLSKESLESIVGALSRNVAYGVTCTICESDFIKENIDWFIELIDTNPQWTFVSS